MDCHIATLLNGVHLKVVVSLPADFSCKGNRGEVYRLKVVGGCWRQRGAPDGVIWQGNPVAWRVRNRFTCDGPKRHEFA